jgi:hypothetical protein
MKISHHYIWTHKNKKLDNILAKILTKKSNFVLRSQHGCNLYMTTFFGSVCQKEFEIKLNSNTLFDEHAEYTIRVNSNLSYVILESNSSKYMIIFYYLVNSVIDLPIDYHRWNWIENEPQSSTVNVNTFDGLNFPGLILIPNINNDLQNYGQINFKKYLNIGERDVKNCQIKPETNYHHPDINLKFYVDVRFPISIYAGSQKTLVLGETLGISDQTDVGIRSLNRMNSKARLPPSHEYIDISIPLDLSETYYISCNDVISRKVQPIIRIQIGVYNKKSLLYSDYLIFRIAPIIFTPNNLRVSTLYLSQMNGTGIHCNRSFINEVSKIVKKSGHQVVVIQDKNISGFHRWMQDILKFTYVTDGQKTQQILLKGPHFTMNNNKKSDTSYTNKYFPSIPMYDFFYESDDNLFAFGNVQVIPPCGSKYPFGRIIYGHSNEGSQKNIDYNLIDLLESQQIQKPISVETGWLSVGHVDEILSYVPDANHRNGFRILIASPRKFNQLLSTLDPQTVIFEANNYIFHKLTTDIKKRYTQRYPNKDSCIYKATLAVGELLNWDELVTDNEFYQEKIDGVRAILTRELDLQPDDFHEVPIYYWPKSCFDRARSILPNMINNLYLEKLLLVPKPFGPKNDGIDLFESYFLSQIPTDVKVHFIRNWDSYYLLEGDINCGTNAQRHPFTRPWWTHKPEGSYNI